MDAVFRIDHATKNVVWKLGGTVANHDGAVALQLMNDSLGGPKRPHDARLLPDGSISVFDNRLDSPGATRAAVYSINTTNHTATLTRSYARPDGGDVGTMGSVRVQPDGHLVIGW